MNGFSVCSIGSGSKGNCIYLKGGNTSLLLDAGLSAKATEEGLKALGTSLSEIDAILVTHEHSDHVKGLNVIAKKYGIPVHIPAPCAARLHAEEELKKALLPHPPVFETVIGEVAVSSFPAPHDSVCCVGYRLTCGGHTLTAATDVGSLDTDLVSRFLGSEAIIVEANHDVSLLRANPAYPPELKERILSPCGHLSNDLCARFVAFLAEHGTKYVMLAHLSPDNNTPELALGAVREKLTVPLTLCAAAEKELTRLL